MPIDLHVATGTSVPIYRQVIDQVRLAVGSGALVPGEQLPSVRALAEQLLVNPNTVAHAYAELARQGVLETAQGRGVFVAQRRQVFSKGEQMRRLDHVLGALVSEMVATGLSRDEVVQALDVKMRKLGLSETARKK